MIGMDGNYDIRDCARCGQDHEQLEFKSLTRPVEYHGESIYQLWALCPVSGEPILMRVEVERKLYPDEKGIAK